MTPTPLTSERTHAAEAARLTAVQWAVCGVAALGFAFDVYEVLLISVIARPALGELASLRPGDPALERWVGLLFYVPFAVGGLFGLYGGELADRFGRRRVLTWSILLYGAASFASAFATSPGALLALRCATIAGVCIEYVAAIAWLAEIFPNARQREKAIAYTQAFTSLGGLMVTVGYYVAVTYGDRFPPVMGDHQAWRYTLLSGLIPAVPLAVVRPLLPESPVWLERRASGALRQPRVGELFGPALRRTTLVSTVMVALSLATTFGATQHIPRIVPGLPGVRGLAPMAIEQTVSAVHLFDDLGQLAGRLLLALLVVRVASQRRLIRLFLVPSVVLFPLVFAVFARADVNWMKAGAFLTSMLVVAQFSVWWNYLPRVFPTHLRATGEGFAGNVGGRMFGTMAALVTTQLAVAMPAGDPSGRLAYAAAVVSFVTCAAGLIASVWLPEPISDRLPD